MSIGFVKGPLAGLQRLGSRAIALIEAGGVGYEVQLLPRQASQLPLAGEVVQVFTHWQLRDDRLTLYGFLSLAERDLFRQLIAVNGVGPQLALALMDGLDMESLVGAIVAGNARLLAKTPGIGQKTAERIALELKTKLAEWRDRTGLSLAPGAGPTGAVLEDVELTLVALGYSDREVRSSLEAVGQETALAKTGDAEAWIKAAISWLSR